MFVQIDRSSAGAQAGLGIGLALVKRVIELHDGSISAASDGEGRGCCFTIRLRALPDRQSPASGAADVEPERGPARRILVVDDNHDAADSLAKLLQLSGHETRTAYDGPDAVALADSFRPEVVLLDLGLVTMSGHDACRAIRSQPGGTSMRIFALTGWGQEDDRQRSEAAGFDGHLVKPVEYATLLRLLEAESLDPS